MSAKCQKCSDFHTSLSHFLPGTLVDKLILNVIVHGLFKVSDRLNKTLKRITNTVQYKITMLKSIKKTKALSRAFALNYFPQHKRDQLYDAWSFYSPVLFNPD